MSSATLSGPTKATVARLYGLSGNRCAFPGCTTRIVQGDTMVGAICHIRAASPQGPRYAEGQTDQERHGIANLMLLCANHHRIIDNDIKSYPVDVLEKMKADHQASMDALGDDEAEAGATILLGQVADHAVVAARYVGTVNVFHHPQPQSPRPLPDSAGMVFAGFDEVLSHMGPAGKDVYSFDTKRFAYMRLIPPNGFTGIGQVTVWKTISDLRLLAMSKRWNADRTRNKYGAMYYITGANRTIQSLTQAFPTGELWGKTSMIFDTAKIAFHPDNSPEDVPVIVAVTMEQTYLTTLDNYVQVADKVLNIPLPYTIELGITGIEHMHIVFPRPPDGSREGPIYRDSFRQILTLEDAGESARHSLLSRYFDTFYSELVGRRRKDVIAASMVDPFGLPPWE